MIGMLLIPPPPTTSASPGYQTRLSGTLSDLSIHSLFNGAFSVVVVVVGMLFALHDLTRRQDQVQIRRIFLHGIAQGDLDGLGDTGFELVVIQVNLAGSQHEFAIDAGDLFHADETGRAVAHV